MKIKSVISSMEELSKLTSAEIMNEFNVDNGGHNEEQVLDMKKNYGENQIISKKSDSYAIKFIQAFISPFTMILILLTVVSTFTDILLVKKEDQNYATVLIITTMVIVSGILRFIQEFRSNHAAEKLQSMIQTTTTVIRSQGERQEIPLKEVVVGDLIILAAGDLVPADLRILQSKDLFISQSILNGESKPIEKFSINKEENDFNYLNYSNLLFMGSNVVSGSAQGIVIRTGNTTYFGSMAKSIQQKKVDTSFELGIRSVSWLLIRFMLSMVPIVFFINGVTKGDWLQAFLFALSIAVGLTPEMLPMIVTTNLAKGASKMAKKKTIVKNLGSIQDFGAMDVLCTDKTGTLTQDKVVLEYYFNIDGKEDNRVFRHAFLNSYYQTGLKNLMDVAILNHRKKEDDFLLNYQKVDEVPFDFNRRRMSVVVKNLDGKTQMITKGAVEEMLPICSFVEIRGEVLAFTVELRQKILKEVNEQNELGMRVIAVAQKTNPSKEGFFSTNDECNMVLIGYLAFLDPAKETAAQAIEALHKYGVQVKILTGDNDGVTKNICKKVGLDGENIILGSEIEKMDKEVLKKVVETCNVFAKLTPYQKSIIVTALRENGHVVGYLGDGMNDAAAMKVADISVSVDTAVDIAKESADIILLEKDLMILEKGVIEGRKTFGNIIKYIKMTSSSNFGNMLSVLLASAFLPFLPMLPLQLLILNLIYDFSCLSIPWDTIDEDFLKKPKKWKSSSIKNFMFWMGPTSSLFDIITYLILFFVICPLLCGGFYGSEGVNNVVFIATFHTGWFIESLWSQVLIIHFIRTPKIPFIQSRAATPVIVLSLIAIVVGTILPYTFIGSQFNLIALPFIYYPFLIGIIILYGLTICLVKTIYQKHFNEYL